MTKLGGQSTNTNRDIWAHASIQELTLSEIPSSVNVVQEAHDRGLPDRSGGIHIERIRRMQHLEMIDETGASFQLRVWRDEDAALQAINTLGLKLVIAEAIHPGRPETPRIRIEFHSLGG